EADLHPTIETEHRLERPHRHTPFRRTATPIDQAVVPPALVPLAPAPQIARGHLQNVRGGEPRDLAADRPQHHILNPHRPLPRGRRILHDASSTSLSYSISRQKRTGHLLSG